VIFSESGSANSSFHLSQNNNRFVADIVSLTETNSVCVVVCCDGNATFQFMVL